MVLGLEGDVVTVAVEAEVTVVLEVRAASKELAMVAAV